MRSRSPSGQQFEHRLKSSCGASLLSWQYCRQCERLQYPPAEICRECLSDEIIWREREISGKVVSCVAVHRSYADDFSEGGPWWVASVALATGVVCYAHALHQLAAGTAVLIVAVEDRLGEGVLAALETPADRDELQRRFT